MSAKQYLIETEDESNLGYREQKKDENAHKKKKFKKRAKPNSRFNKSPPGAHTTEGKLISFCQDLALFN